MLLLQTHLQLTFFMKSKAKIEAQERRKAKGEELKTDT